MIARLEPTQVSVSGRDDALEGLRGCAALAVLYAHLTANGPYLDPAYVPPKFLGVLEVAIPGVMLFFVLSGYVIGLTNQQPATGGGVRSYFRRRALRLLPVYLAAVFFGWLVRPSSSVGDLVGNVLFLQNEVPDNPFHVGLLPGNPNLWSLHYEVVYYLLFISVWWLRPPVLLMLLVALALATCGAVVPGMSIFVAWLACGFVFWIAGLLVVWRMPQAEAPSLSPWLSALMVCTATWKLGALGAIVARAGFVVNWVPGVLFTYLDSLPSLLWLFLLVSRRRPPWLRWLEFAAWGWPAAFLGWRVLRHTASGEHGVEFAGGLLAMALALRGWKLPLAFWQQLAPVGAISYGLYAFGYPVQILTRTFLPGSWSGHWWTYAGRVVVTLGLTFAIAWFFEKWCRTHLSVGRKRRAADAVVQPA